MQRIALLSACLVIAGCDQAPSSPTSPPPNLEVRGEITVNAPSNGGIFSIEAQVDGRHVGYRGGNDPFGSARLTVQLAPDNAPTFADAATVQPGTHEIAVVVGVYVSPSGDRVVITDSSSRIEIVNRDSRVVIGTAGLRSQEVSAGSRQVIRWTIDVDSAGRVRVQ